jgi:hypothetical protein
MRWSGFESRAGKASSAARAVKRSPRALARPQAVAEFSILDVTVQLIGDRVDLAYAGAFLDAYDSPRAGPSCPAMTVSVGRTKQLANDRGPARELWVHRSKHPYWNVRGVRAGRRAVRWLNRPIVSSLTGDAGAEVRSPVGASAEMTGEAAWHVCRNLALYLRDARAGKLLHASAAVLDGRCVMFVGAVSAGKTTLMTETVLAHGAQPLANDRVLVNVGTPLQAVSWPSYASFTEGTLLDYEPLRRAALDYEAGGFGHRTQTWTGALSHRYGKDAKRTYPMSWFSKAVGRAYRRSAPVGAIVLSRLSPDVGRPFVQPVDLDDAGERAAVAQLLSHECFDDAEPSFCPWHDLSLPAGAPDATLLLDELIAQQVPVYRLQTGPASLRATLADLIGGLSFPS